jgi:hypothetical protein
LAASAANSDARSDFINHPDRSGIGFSGLEHDPEKWKPVFRKDHAQSKRRDHDAIPYNRIMI